MTEPGPGDPRHPVVLTIAGSDSGGGAGIQADLRTFALHGVHGASVIAALTAQNTCGVQGVFPVPAAFVQAQLDSVLTDLRVVAAKSGMLGDPEVIGRLAETWRRERPGPLVVDPVMVATSGDRLLPVAAEQVLVERWLPLAELLTPNLPEAEVLLGRPIGSDVAAREVAGRELQARWGCWVLLKGGHADARDLLIGPGHLQWLGGERIETPHTHGTGCHLSAAIAARLGRGEAVPEAVVAAKAWLTRALQEARPVGHGRSSPWPGPA